MIWPWILAVVQIGMQFICEYKSLIKPHYLSLNMCTSPVQRTISYKGSFSKKTITVPCGKCAECRAKLQSEFAALSCLEAESAGSIGFLTLTYNNESMPYLMTVQDKFGEIYPRTFMRDCEVVVRPDIEPCKPFSYPAPPGSDFDFFYLTPSLCRKDVQKMIKRFRQDYFRRHGERCDFRFTFFGEYGERFKRPHYHMLVYGLDNVELDYLCKQWKFGFIDRKFIEHFNADGSDAFVKVSRYVSKYVGKRDFLPDFVQKGFAERPRKQSSIALGQRDIKLAELRNFILPRNLQVLRYLRKDCKPLLTEKSGF